MFKTTSTVTEPAPAEVPDPSGLIPLSVLQLDLPAPSGGWDAFLAGRGIAIVSDDIGRKSVSRGDARMLLDEQHEAEARKREVAERQERQAIEADRVRRASIWGGVPATAIPEGVSAASAMLTAAHDARPRRRSVLEDALSNSGTTLHSFQSTPDDDEL
jgi:hypothetical protein